MLPYKIDRDLRNSLPLDVRGANSANSFKAKLKTYLVVWFAGLYLGPLMGAVVIIACKALRSIVLWVSWTAAPAFNLCHDGKHVVLHPPLHRRLLAMLRDSETQPCSCWPCFASLYTQMPTLADVLYFIPLEGVEWWPHRILCSGGAPRGPVFCALGRGL